MAYTQPPRTAVDGPIDIGRTATLGGDGISISVTHDGKVQRLVMSEYNAARVFGSLAVLLGITLSTAVGKSIKL